MRVQKNKYDRIVSYLTLAVLMGKIIFMVIYWHKIPDIIPIHYDLFGNINGWGSKYIVICIPIMSVFIYILMTFVEKHPRLWNTGITINEKNKIAVYRNLLHLLCTSKLIVVSFFTYLTFHTIFIWRFPQWITFCFLIALVLNGVYWIYHCLKAK